MMSTWFLPRFRSSVSIEQDKLSLIRKGIKVKKLIFSEFPNNFVLFKKYNIFSTKMYQNLLELHGVDSSNQEIITVMKEQMFLLQTLLLSALNHQKNLQSYVWWHLKGLLLEWPPSEKKFFVAFLENGLSVQSSAMIRSKIQSMLIAISSYQD